MTTLVRRNQNWLPSVFNDLFETEFPVHTPGLTVPAINVKENDNSYVVEVAAPGMTKEDFGLHIDEEENLVVSLEKKEEEKSEGKVENNNERYIRREFSFSKFQQAMILPEDVDKDKISANMKDGVLKIELPKLQPDQIKKAERKIEIL